MMPPKREPSKRSGSKGPMQPPSGPPRPAGKPASQPPPGKPPSKPASLPPSGKPASKPVARPGTPPPASTGKTSKPVMRPQGPSGASRRTAGLHAGTAKKSNVKAIAIGAALCIVAVIGILFGIRSTRINPEEIKAELKTKLDEVKQIEDIIEKHEKLKELQRNPNYTVANCGQVRRELDKLEGETRPHAERQKKANEEVLPWLEKYEQGKTARDQDTAQMLLDQVSSLISEYSTTTYGEKLQAAKVELMAWLEANTTTDSPEGAWPPTKISSDRAANEGDYAQAFKLVEDFAKRYQGRLSTTLQRQVDEQKSSLGRRLRSFVEDTVKQAKDMNERGQGEPAKEKLRRAMEGTKGLDVYQQLERALKEIGS